MKRKLIPLWALEDEIDWDFNKITQYEIPDLVYFQLEDNVRFTWGVIK